MRRTIAAGFNDPVHFSDDYLFFFVIVDSIPLLVQDYSSPDAKSDDCLLRTDPDQTLRPGDQLLQPQAKEQTFTPGEPETVEQLTATKVESEEIEEVCNSTSLALTVQTDDLVGESDPSVSQSCEAASTTPDQLPSGEHVPEGESFIPFTL